MGQLLLATTFFVTGILILHHLSVLPPSSMVILYLAALTGLLLSKNRIVTLVCLLIFGFGWAHLQAFLMLQGQLPANYIGKDLRVIGYVASLPQQDQRKTRFEFDIKSYVSPEITVRPGRVRLSLYRPTDFIVHAGDKLELTVRLKPPRDYFNPGGFSYSAWLLQKKILHTGYVRAANGIRSLDSSFYDYPILKLRQFIQRKVVLESEQIHAQGFLRALLIGDRAGLGNQDWDVLQSTGTTHLMAISGLHVGLIAGIAFFLGRFLWARSTCLSLRFAAPRAAAVFSWLAALAYSGLAGFTIPTQRALIMLSIVLLFVLLQKQHKPVVVLCLCLFAVLLVDSFAVLSASFWLSFFAVAIIYYFVFIQNRKSAGLMKWAHLQLMISFSLIPMTILFFQQASFISPIANIIAVPVVGFIIVPLCFISGVMLLFNDAIAGWLFEITGRLFDVLWSYLEWLSEFELAHNYFSSSSPLTFLSALVGVLLLILPGRLHLRGVGLVCVIPLFFTFHQRPAPGEVIVTTLDVGQGLATVIQTSDHALLFDTGPKFSNKFDAGKAVIVPYLRTRGIQQLDMVMISHGDNDHIGGFKSVSQHFPVKRLFSSVPQKLSAHQPKRCVAGQSWTWNSVEFSVLHPAKSDYRKGFKQNDLSCVLQIKTQDNQKILLTGDIEKQAEALILSRYESLQSNLLIVPHHGSKTSSSEGFIRAVKPEMAIIPAGWRNRYRFPHESVLQTLKQQGSRIFSTASLGAIQYQSSGSGLDFYRPENLRYWHRD